MEKKITLSVAIATFNEEQNIETCLASVSDWADEIVIVDGGSTDKTCEIASKYTTTIIHADNPLMFHINKQKALDACKGVWILQLDADEIVTEELGREILKQVQDDRHNGYYIPRKNYFWGHFMKKGGQYPDYVIRLVRKGFARFPCKTVHEQIEIQGEVGYLKESMLHYPYRTSEDYWKKANAYTTLTARDMKSAGVPNNVQTWILYMKIKPMQTFLSLFIRHKGFMDGWYGLVFAYWSALHYPIAYRKYVKMI